MSEYATVVEVWFEASSQDEADVIALDIATVVFEREDVHSVEAGEAEGLH